MERAVLVWLGRPAAGSVITVSDAGRTVQAAAWGRAKPGPPAPRLARAFTVMPADAGRDYNPFTFTIQSLDGSIHCRFKLYTRTLKTTVTAFRQRSSYNFRRIKIQLGRL